MKKTKGEVINGRVWQPTDKFLNGMRLYKSIAGHVSVEMDGMYLVSPKVAGVCSVCGIVHGDGWDGECHAS